MTEALQIIAGTTIGSALAWAVGIWLLPRNPCQGPKKWTTLPRMKQIDFRTPFAPKNTDDITNHQIEININIRGPEIKETSQTMVSNHHPTPDVVAALLAEAMLAFAYKCGPEVHEKLKPQAQTEERDIK